MTLNLKRPLAVAGLAGALAAASLLPTATAPAATPVAVASTPVLYAVSGAHQGRPVAYVVLRTNHRVHDTDAVKVRVGGRTGRSYSVGAGACIRAAFVKETAAGTPQPFLKAGHRYSVRI